MHVVGEGRVGSTVRRPEKSNIFFSSNRKIEGRGMGWAMGMDE